MSAFFAAEVMYRRRPLVEKLIYSLIATLVAYFLSTIAQSGHRTLFDVESLFLPPDDWLYYGLVLLMSLAVMLVSVLFIKLRRVVEQQFHQRPLGGTGGRPTARLRGRRPAWPADREAHPSLLSTGD
ncbi:MAG: chloride channel protein [Candidatus Promineofilum sp.]|nr:chloride channel protein [Promineifilum sp.]